MEPSEIEFLAEKEKVDIVPNFTHGVLDLIQGEAGPFRANHRVTVPLWLAVMFKQRRRCQIVKPDWMEQERLDELLEQERESPFFIELPAPHIFEVSNMILDAGAEDIARSDDIRKTLKDIWDTRQAKLRKSVDLFVRGNYLHAKINHLQPMELNIMRPLLPHAFDQINRLNLATAVARRAGQSMNSSNSSFFRNF